jgi:hypothetical protein
MTRRELKMKPKIPKDQAWLFEPRNKAVLGSLQKSLKQEPSVDWETIRKKLDVE